MQKAETVKILQVLNLVMTQKRVKVMKVMKVNNNKSDIFFLSFFHSFVFLSNIYNRIRGEAMKMNCVCVVEWRNKDGRKKEKQLEIHLKLLRKTFSIKKKKVRDSLNYVWKKNNKTFFLLSLLADTGNNEVEFRFDDFLKRYDDFYGYFCVQKCVYR